MENSLLECKLSQSVLLNLLDLQAADEGEYQCVAESEAGTAERTITIKVQGEFHGQHFILTEGANIWKVTATTQARKNKGFENQI